MGFSPSVGWVTTDNLVVGATILTNFSSSNYPNSVNYIYSSTTGAGFYMRKYLPVGKSFYLFGNGQLSVVSLYNKNSTPQQPFYYKEKGYAVNVTVVPGIAYQINNCLFLEAALNNLLSLEYTRTNRQYQNSGNSNTSLISNSFGLSTGLGSVTPLQIGMRWMIVRK